MQSPIISRSSSLLSLGPESIVWDHTCSTPIHIGPTKTKITFPSQNITNIVQQRRSRIKQTSEASIRIHVTMMAYDGMPRNICKLGPGSRTSMGGRRTSAPQFGFVVWFDFKENNLQIRSDTCSNASGVAFASILHLTMAKRIPKQWNSRFVFVQDVRFLGQPYRGIPCTVCTLGPRSRTSIGVRYIYGGPHMLEVCGSVWGVVVWILFFLSTCPALSAHWDQGREHPWTHVEACERVCSCRGGRHHGRLRITTALPAVGHQQRVLPRRFVGMWDTVTQTFNPHIVPIPTHSHTQFPHLPTKP